MGGSSATGRPPSRLSRSLRSERGQSVTGCARSREHRVEAVPARGARSAASRPHGASQRPPFPAVLWEPGGPGRGSACARSGFVDPLLTHTRVPGNSEIPRRRPRAKPSRALQRLSPRHTHGPAAAPGRTPAGAFHLPHGFRRSENPRQVRGSGVMWCPGSRATPSKSTLNLPEPSPACLLDTSLLLPARRGASWECQACRAPCSAAFLISFYIFAFI